MSMKNQLIEYVPPKRSTVLQFSRDVCEQMGISDAETVRGLCNFLEVVSQITARHMSSQDIETDNQPQDN